MHGGIFICGARLVVERNPPVQSQRVAAVDFRYIIGLPADAGSQIGKFQLFGTGRLVVERNIQRRPGSKVFRQFFINDAPREIGLDTVIELQNRPAVVAVDDFGAVKNRLPGLFIVQGRFYRLPDGFVKNIVRSQKIIVVILFGYRNAAAGKHGGLGLNLVGYADESDRTAALFEHNLPGIANKTQTVVVNTDCHIHGFVFIEYNFLVRGQRTGRRQQQAESQQNFNIIFAHFILP